MGRKLAYLDIRTVLVLLVWTIELLPVPEKLGLYEAVDSLTPKPKACYLILKETEGHIREQIHVIKDYRTCQVGW